MYNYNFLLIYVYFVEIVYVVKALADLCCRRCISHKNWEFLRQALVSREKYKADAWAILTATEQQQLEAIVPVEIKLLKTALKQGAIAAFKEVMLY